MGCMFTKPGAENATLSASLKSDDQLVASVKSFAMEVSRPPASAGHVDAQIPALQSLQLADHDIHSSAPVLQAHHSESPSKQKKFPPLTVQLSKQPKSGVSGRQGSFVQLLDSLTNQPAATGPVLCKAAGVKHIGFGPMKKENQDEYFVQAGNFAGVEAASCFCIFDGHGVNGRAAAAFCCANLPSILEMQLRKVFNSHPSAGTDVDWMKLSVEQAICDVFQETEERLEQSGVNLSSSGTTATVVYMHGVHVWVAAVGDSRVVLCRKEAPNWAVLPLTLDHRPGRPGEKARVEAAGGRVEPKRLASGRCVGEPRLWLANLPSPGLLLSRSLGDLVAASVGCTCHPEVTYFALQEQDRYLVLGSDGVWDVLSNEQVCELVQCTSNPEQACQAVLDMALFEWEERMAADNVSVVVVEATWPDVKVDLVARD